MLNSVVKCSLIVAGSLFLLLGVAGIFLPLLPATPFLLLASACYMRGSDKLHRWLLRNRYLGDYIRHFEEHKGLPLRAKLIVLLTLWVSLAFSLYTVELPKIRLFLVAIGCIASFFILRIKTYRGETTSGRPS